MKNSSSILRHNVDLDDCQTKHEALATAARAVGHHRGGNIPPAQRVSRNAPRALRRRRALPPRARAGVGSDPQDAPQQTRPQQDCLFHPGATGICKRSLPVQHTGLGGESGAEHRLGIQAKGVGGRETSADTGRFIRFG